MKCDVTKIKKNKKKLKFAVDKVGNTSLLWRQLGDNMPNQRNTNKRSLSAWIDKEKKMNNENIKHLNLRLPMPLFQKLAAKAKLEDRKPGPFAVLLIEKIFQEKDR